MQNSQVFYLTHPDFLLHDMGEGHPERPDRLQAIDTALRAQPWFRELQLVANDRIGLADDEPILRAHDDNVLQRIASLLPTQGLAQLDPDTAINPHSEQAARRAAAAAILAVDLAIANNSKAFCAVRPPGHHAERGRSMGFCLFNNIAIAAYHALDVHKLKRVAIIDFDVHHGNGTEDIVANDERILMLSTFQSPLYPYSGTQPLGGNMANVALPPNSDGGALREAVAQHWAPAMDNFKPELILISAGFDAHERDPLAGLRWLAQDYAWLTHWLCEKAAAYCNGSIVSCLEGGYDLQGLSESVVAHVAALAKA